MDKEHKVARSDFEASRIRFLDAADRVFVRNGYDRSTIREITAEAKTSLARLNRHWTGKQHLFADMFARHFNPIHAAQNARFDVLEAGGGEEATDPRAILEAFFSPALPGGQEQDKDHLAHRVYCRALIDPSAEASELVHPLVRETRARLVRLLRNALPTLDEQDFFLALTAVLGTYLYSQVYGERLAAAVNVNHRAIDWNRAGSILSSILADGLRRAASPAG
ncbi:MAG: TetR/AcrR family transcriptional regulator [Sphingomonadales bacterium]|nr:MAG: TetR/AcrR family transcriptional regulator [Sphingomonadales bacterium]TNF03429.1 MAG: TetR/AcrR family transcriptional regulator [Sphingomonadales bacterium]